MATRTARSDVYPTSRAKYVTRARGQASRSLINRELPHRVLMRAEDVRGRALDAVYAFHDNRGVPVRCHSLRKDDEWYSVYCFTGRGMAEGFNLLFGGQLLNALKPR
jgi:hypothetical protein